jgi:hypothetical protein
MKIIDGEGRVFGKINVIDLSVILIIAACAFFSARWIMVAEDPSWVRVELSNIRCIVGLTTQKYLVNNIRKGDDILDSEGKSAGKIGKILENKPCAVKVYSSKDGEKIFFDMDNMVEVEFEVELTCYRRNRVLYASVDSMPLKIGRTLYINTENITCRTIILKILGYAR